MADVYGQTIAPGSQTVGDNARKTSVGTIGIAEVKWIKIADTGIGTNYANANSQYHRATAIMQHAGFQIIYAPALTADIATYMVDANLSSAIPMTGTGSLKELLDADGDITATPEEVALAGVGPIA